MKETAVNVFGKPLVVCGTDPMTGAYRNGCCDTGPFDSGTHTVCAVVTDAFLTFSKSKGNDLTRAYPEYDFPGLIAGDHWCLCVSRWLEAYRSDVAPQIILDACHHKTLDHVSLDVLKKFAFDPA
ncbi:MAG: hypothetical protein CMP52_00565 [Flavobacteriales bacterium]|jgi:uncharacterized protein (DUF2237 family)|nr:hypothetical protein [Candidatus Arcticimaribacter sp.]MBT4826094.1 DUF2237 domain-containing protein [Flavobacteriaceae bacterium]NCF30714.1 DUF2237 family protein [Bacteroidota bacterium]MBT6127474.1 DUF2237 domain-containing protein [Flavobacteriaceae bacterium]MDG1027976.1 DUF2237 domain-containing protein [Flavobacteriaceae bacterium]